MAAATASDRAECRIAFVTRVMLLGVKYRWRRAMAEKSSDSNVKQAVPFFAVSNMENSLRFYVGRLGFEMTQNG